MRELESVAAEQIHPISHIQPCHTHMQQGLAGEKVDLVQVLACHANYISSGKRSLGDKSIRLFRSLEPLTLY